MLFLRIVILIAVGFCGGPLPVHGADLVQSVHAPNAFRVFGYLPEYQVEKIDPEVGKYVTDLIFYSLQPKANGSLDRTQLSDEECRVLNEIRKQGARLHVSFGGGNRSSAFSAISSAEDARANFIQNVISIADDYSLSGIDLNWEFPNAKSDNGNFAILLENLKAELSKKNRTLSIAVAPWQELPRAAIDAVDLVHVMAYDGAGKHSTLDFAKAQQDRVLQRGVPASKLCLGIPFYGRNVQERSRALSYSQIVLRHKPKPNVDEIAGYYFNSPQTVSQKARLAIDKGLAGVMIWELGQDTNDDVSLLRAIHKSLPKPVLENDRAEP